MGVVVSKWFLRAFERLFVFFLRPPGAELEVWFQGPLGPARIAPNTDPAGANPRPLGEAFLAPPVFS